MSPRLIGAAIVCMAGLASAAGGDQARTIPLESVYSTSDQKGLKHATHGFTLDGSGGKRYVEPFGYWLEKTFSNFQGGPSHVVLVRGTDITQAMRATSRAFGGGGWGSTPVGPNDESKPTELWLVAYLGSGGHSDFPIQSVERNGKSIRLAYGHHTTEDRGIYRHFFWVPLGELERGTYTLELFDTDRKEVTLLRRVTW